MKPRKLTLKNGTVVWDARWYGPDGREKAKTFTLRREAVAYAAKMEADISSGQYLDPAGRKTLFRTLAEEHRDAALRPTTKSTRGTVVNQLGTLGDMPIGAVKPAHIQEWAAGQLADGIKPSTVKSRLIVIKAVCNRAVEDGLIPRNPAKRVKVEVPPDTVTAHDVPTPVQVNALIDVFQDGSIITDDEGNTVRRHAPSRSMTLAVKLAANTGMRVSEVLGLRAVDVNEGAGTITLAEQQGRRPRKTARSERTIQLDKDTMSSLVAYVRDWGVSGVEQVIRGRGGQPLTYKSVQHFMRTRVPDCGYPDHMTFHSLRHFHATMLLRAGVPIKLVSARLGHGSVTQTLNVYAHFLPEDEGVAAGVVAGVLRNNCGISPGAGNVVEMKKAP